MTAAVYGVIYAGLLVFLAGCVRRVIEYANKPIHLRWEVYPVPHEEAKRAAHGGSYFETGDWWTKPRHSNRIGELRVMVPEILFLKGLWEFNRRLWLSSFLFHFGLYLLIGTVVLVAITSGLVLVEPSMGGGSLWTALTVLYKVTGCAGAILTIIGALLLLLRRATDKGLKNYTKPADFFNLLFFIVTFLVVAAAYLLRPVGSAGIGRVAIGLFRFDTDVEITPLLGAGLMLTSALLAYIPFTHMAHFIAKYFTYHLVRWDNRLNVRGGSLEVKLAEYLTYRPTWSAAHVGADGKKTWAEVATTNPAQEARK